MSVWKFLGEIALFDMIRRWFTSTHHSPVSNPVPTPVPSVTTNLRAPAARIFRDRCSVDELHERVDALESELDDLDIMSERYDDIQERIDLLLDRIDEIEETENTYLPEDDYDTDHRLFDDDNY